MHQAPWPLIFKHWWSDRPMHMAKTSFSFCPLLLCSSSPRHIKFQYRRKKRNSCIFGLANFFLPPVTSRGSPIVGCSHSSPSVPHSSPAHSWARGKISYMAAAARYTANHPQHSRYTTRNTTRYTTRNTAETLPGAAFPVRTENWLVFSFHSLKASKLQNAAPASSSVVLRVV